MQKQRHSKRATAALCALLIALVLESGFCAAAHAHEHAVTGSTCTQSHCHEADCDDSSDPAPCPDGCRFEEHRHEQLVAPSTGSSPFASRQLLPTAASQALLPRRDAGFESVLPAAFALPPPEHQRTTVLLI